MIWMQTMSAIFVFYNNDSNHPGWMRYQDRWQQGAAESDPTFVPSEGLYQPVRGFGEVWRNEPGVRDRLGWALTLEQSFDGAYQRDSLFKYNNFYLRIADGRVIHLKPEFSGWEFVNP